MNAENKNNTSISASDMEQNTCNDSNGKKKIKRLDTQCSIHIHSKRYRLADVDGLSGKAVIDALVIVGILEDDSPKEIKEVSYSQEKIKKHEPEVTIVTLEWEV